MSNTFESFNWSDEQKEDAERIKAHAYDLEEAILKANSVPRYRALAMASLEAAIMFANKGVSRVEL